MARVLKSWNERCACRHGCPTSATLKRWSCDCVTVEIHNDRAPGRDCTNFSAKRRYCSKSGWPDGH